MIIKKQVQIFQIQVKILQLSIKGRDRCMIFFPQAGPETERAWIYHALNENLKLL